MDYSIKLDEFEGPLDLLLHLIKQDNIDIYDISIERITKQYLDYIEKMEELNINIAASYLVMAAELMEIKSNSLLPRNKEVIEENNEEEVTKDNLINRLIEYKKYKEVTNELRILENKRFDYYVKGPENINNYIENNNYNKDASVDDLLQAFEKYLERQELKKPLQTKVTNKEYSISKRKQSIRNILNTKSKIEFSELFEEYNKSYIIVTFLSVLEMAKEDEITITQMNNFDNILIEKKVK